MLPARLRAAPTHRAAARPTRPAPRPPRAAAGAARGVPGGARGPRRWPAPPPPGPASRTQQSEHLIRRLDARAHRFLRAGQIAEVPHADAAPAVLVFIGGTDPPPRGPDLLLLLARPIKQLVIRER